jgi:UDP-N-acetylmuramoyl-L-alanyl-D-glutamate--2,6-diaminopimelate ligase
MSAAAFHAADVLARVGVRPGRLSADSRGIGPGDGFVAYPGEARDGREFIPDAIARGARAVFWEPEGFAWNPDWRVANTPVAGLRERAGELASAFHGEPSRALRVVGVTGTNGKTTCTWAIATCLQAAGTRTGLIGTLGNGYPEALVDTGNTTPDALVLQELLARFRDDGARAVAMEVSSHGLVQGRVNGTVMFAAVFTNLTRDHLDYHGDMASYAAAKARLFALPGLRHAIVHADDPYAAGMVAAARANGCAVTSYGIGTDGRGPGVWADGVEATARGVAFDIVSPWGRGRLLSAMVGRFNVLNLLAVCAALGLAGVPFEQALGLVAQAHPPPGRMQRLGGDGRPLVVIDYSHSPDALENVLATLREALPRGGRLWCVFGCGGDRDRGKRPLMGAVAARLADEVVVTSDNPRGEAAVDILREVGAGIGRPYAAIEDRAAAIRHAVAEAATDDVVLVAGKGHEAYQEIGGRRLPFSDLDQARRALREAWGHVDDR